MRIVTSDSVIEGTKPVVRNVWTAGFGIIRNGAGGFRAVSPVLVEMAQAADEFSQDVEFDVDACSHADGVEVGVLVGEWNDVYLKGIVGGVAYGEAHAVDGDWSFVNGEVSFACHFPVERIFESVGVASFGILDSGAYGGFVDVTLHDMSVQTFSQWHGSFKVYLVSHLELPQVGTV